MSESRFQSMENKIDEIKEDVKKIAVDLAGLPKKIFDEADDKYASKNIEKWFYVGIGIVVLFVIETLLRKLV